MRGPSLFADVTTVEQFYLQLSVASGGQLGNKENTLVFLDEIQVYPELLTLLKFLNKDARYTYIASGSMFGIALKITRRIKEYGNLILHSI